MFYVHNVVIEIIELSLDFYFLITYGVCKKGNYCNRKSEKKKILSYWQMFMIFMS